MVFLEYLLILRLNCFDYFSYYFFQMQNFFGFSGREPLPVPDYARRRAQVRFFSPGYTLPIPRHFFCPGTVGEFIFFKNGVFRKSDTVAMFSARNFATLGFSSRHKQRN